MRGGEIGFLFDRFLILFESFGVAAEVAVRITEFGMCFGVVGAMLVAPTSDS